MVCRHGKKTGRIPPGGWHPSQAKQDWLGSVGASRRRGSAKWWRRFEDDPMMIWADEMVPPADDDIAAAEEAAEWADSDLRDSPPRQRCTGPRAKRSSEHRGDPLPQAAQQRPPQTRQQTFSGGCLYVFVLPVCVIGILLSSMPPMVSKPPPEFKPPPGFRYSPEDAVADAKPGPMGYNDQAEHSGLVRPHVGLSNVVKDIKSGRISGAFNAATYNSPNALALKITDGPGERVVFPKGTIFVPADGSLMQNLILRDNVEVIVGGKEQSVYAYCGNSNFASPHGPMIPTDKVLVADLSSQGSVWRATRQIQERRRN